MIFPRFNVASTISSYILVILGITFMLFYLVVQYGRLCGRSSLKRFFFFAIHSGVAYLKRFKPKKNIPEGSHQYELLKHAEATLGSGNLRMAVMLPGEDLNEWVAVNSSSLSVSQWTLNQVSRLIVGECWVLCFLAFSQQPITK